MKRLLPAVLALVFLCCMLLPASVFAADDSILTLYVAKDGSDSANGTIDAPFASLEKARDTVRAQNKPAVVNIRGGVYEVSESFALGAQDKDTVYRAYLDEEVVFTAANGLDYASFKPLSDEAIKNRIVDKNARDKVVSVSLKDLGITDYGSIHMSGFGYAAAPYSPTLMIDGTAMTIARYPNSDYLMTGNIIEAGANIRDCAKHSGSANHVEEHKGEGMKFTVNDNRLSNWKEANDIWIYGFFMHDWAEATLQATIDFENKNTISTEYPSVYGLAAERRFYFFNLLEELDQPGEWYLDRESGVLYLYPPKEVKNDSVIDFITFSKPFITMEGSSNIQIKGLHIQKGLDCGITVKDAEEIVIADCEFDNISGTVIDMKNVKKSGVTGCYIHDVGGTGVYLDSGDVPTLTAGESYVTNNEIVRFQQIKKTGAPGINITGVGLVVDYNKLSDCANIAIWFGGNDHIIEYNDISDVCKDTADTGAIYAGRHWESRGNKIRYNYIHDFKLIDTTTGMKSQAIYLDDMFSSAEVYSNVFKDIAAVALYGGGRYNTFTNNIMINCSEPFRFDSRGLTWMASGEGSEIRNNLKAVPYDTGIWKEKYPELENILKDQPEVPKYNIIKNNVEYKSSGYELTEEVTQYGTVENNIEIKGTDSFVDFKNGNFTVKEDSEIKEKLPEFEIFDFTKIGLLDDDAEAVEKESVTLFIGSPRAVALGKKTFVDPDNLDVTPLVVDDRTLVPVRFIAESFGAKVGWDGNTQTVTVESAGKTITLVIDSKKMTVGSETVELDVPAQTINDRTLIPLRAIVEALGKQVFWDERGLIVMSEEKDIVTEEDTGIIDILIRNISIQ